MPESPKIPKRRRMDKPSRQLEHALDYADRGWNVIPVTKDKRPLLQTWKEYQTRRATENEIREWWTKWPDAGIAVLTGKISGIVVVDADSEQGEQAVEAVAPATLTARTGGGGMHYYFRYPGHQVPNAVRIMPGVDVRGDGGYVVVPPSGHASGRRYAWIKKDTKIADVPEKILRSMRPEPRGLAPDDWKADIAEGTRDQEMTRRAGKLMRAGMPAGEVLIVLLAVNLEHCKPPLPATQVQKIVDSIAGRERARRDKEVPRPEFTVMSQRDMLRKHGEGEIRWTVEEWLPEASCGLLVAPPGNYKTWILTAMAYSVTTGRPFLGRWPVGTPGPVLIIQQEDPWWMLESRLARMFEQQEPRENSGAHELDCRYVEELDSMPLYWYTDRQLNFSNKAVMAAMERAVEKIRPRLVMIDPLYTAADTKDYMASGAQQMAALKRMRDSYGCSFVVAHHTTVAGMSSDARSSIWGSQFLNAWLEFGWRLPEEERRGSIIIRHFKTSENPKRILVKFRITDWAFLADIDENYVRTDAERIEELVINGGHTGSVREISEKTGVSRSTVQRVLRKLKEAK